MTKITIEINCDNAAFEDNPPEEVARILSRLVCALEDADSDALPEFDGDVLYDSNGNRVGTVDVA